jgi:hypothetical protein
MTAFQLLRDGGFLLTAHPATIPALRRWLPLSARETDAPAPASSGDPGVELRVEQGRAPAADAAAGPADLRLGTAEARVRGASCTLSSPHGAGGRLELSGGRGALVVPPPTGDAARDEAAEWALYSACTLAAALLLGRAGRALTHAAAVADPAGGAWLLVGDAWAGKTTTCANLLAAGWRYVSDDHVVLSEGADGGVVVEGWPRPFHVDEGWGTGAPAGRRAAVDPRTRWPGRWLPSAPLAGLLFPRVEPEAATALEPLPAAAALSALLRQSPWLIGDREAAAGVLALLRRAATPPAHRLRLGLDTFADPPRLARVLEPAVANEFAATTTRSPPSRTAPEPSRKRS